MRRWWTFAAALVLLAGCANRPAPSAPAPFAGPPTLPATFRIADQSTPPLPGKGPIGRGALLYRSPQNPFAPVLLLENGRQFRLPTTAAGEGRQGSLYASLSPDGRWLGHRVAAYTGDGRYVLQELTGARVVKTDGIPMLWSTNSQYVVMAADEQQTGPLTLVEPATGRSTSIGAVRFRDGLGLTGVLPDGELLFTGVPSRSLRLQTDRADMTGVTDATVVFAAGAEDECWCPHSVVHVSPDGRTVSVQLAYDNGLIPGTGEKSRPMPPSCVTIAVIDSASGTVLRHVRPAGPGDSWRLLSDTGAGLLVERTGAGGSALILVDPATGSQHLASELPDGVLSVIVPGQIDWPSDG
jgi:hypothetical protein